MNVQSAALEAGAKAHKSPIPQTLRWEGGEDGCLLLLDQTKLPRTVAYRTCNSVEDVFLAIRELCVRGAPAIGVAAAYGLCLATRPHRQESPAQFARSAASRAAYLESARPTAVNLKWALRRLLRGIASESASSAIQLWRGMLEEAHTMAREDAEICRRIGEHGAALIPDGGGVLTHCNAGALATVAYGTALSLMYVAHEQGKRFKVYADETRPLLQGSRLTAFELAAAGIDVTVLCDGAAASLMASGTIQMVVVGADRIAANGDVANKIGTYGVALAAAAHGVPFYVAAPTSTFDLELGDGGSIPIEQRGADEVREVFGARVAAEGVACFNPAFDVTPAGLIRGIVTENGLVEPVTEQNIRQIVDCGTCKGS